MMTTVYSSPGNRSRTRLKKQKKKEKKKGMMNKGDTDGVKTKVK